MSALRQFQLITTENRESLAENSGQATREANALRCWLESRSPHTVRAYQRHLRDFLTLAAENSIAAACADYETGSAAIDRWREDTESRPYQSRNQRYSAIRSLLRLCERERVYTDPLSHLVPSAKQSEDELRSRLRERPNIDWTTALRAIDREPAGRNQLIMLTLLNTGLRAAELAAAEKADLQDCITENGIVTQRLLVVGKGLKARWVTLRPENSAALHGWLVLCRPENYPTIFGLGEAQIRRVCRDAWARCDVGGGRLGSGAHLLRHIYANYAEVVAVDPALAASMGHSRAATTQDNYVHGVPDPPTGHLPWRSA